MVKKTVEEKKDEWPPWKIGVITTVILLIIMVISANTIWPQIQKQGLYYFQEGPLDKTRLELAPGETYAYSYSTKGQNATISYKLKQGGGCLMVGMSEVRDVPAPCIYADGTDAGRSNVSFANPMVFFFRPWMLAIKPGWNWTVITKSNLSDNVEIDRFGFAYVNQTEYLGRPAYLIEGSMNGKNAARYYVDMEKRVLLKEEGDAYWIEIITAPFPLERREE